MNPNFELAIIDYIANEFHLPVETLSIDTNFKIDLSLQSEEISGLLQRLQDALNFIIPDEKIADIESIGDIITAMSPDKDSPAYENNFL